MTGADMNIVDDTFGVKDLGLPEKTRTNENHTRGQLNPFKVTQGDTVQATCSASTESSALFQNQHPGDAYVRFVES